MVLQRNIHWAKLRKLEEVKKRKPSDNRLF